MCDVLVTADGIELWTLDQAHRYGIAVPKETFNNPIHGDRCLCGADIAPLLDVHSSTWRHERTLSGRGWSEIGPDGRTWWEGYDILEPHPDYDDVDLISRSDGRRALTLEDWEARCADPA